MSERCAFTRFGRLYTCALPHCKGCGSHFDAGGHTHAVLCQACRDWAKVERQVPADILEQIRQRAQSRLEEVL